uniref:Uncharacterized protein n=1 Tax=Trichogramma kaykai TaxID=54128 RepID=A0ABD2WGM3_9HYME
MKTPCRYSCVAPEKEEAKEDEEKKKKKSDSCPLPLQHVYAVPCLALKLARPLVLTHGTRQRKSSGRMHLRERVATNELLLLLKGRRLPSGFASRSPGSDLRQICGSVLKRTRRFKNLAARRLASRRRRRRKTTTTTTLASPKLGLDYYYFYYCLLPLCCAEAAVKPDTSPNLCPVRDHLLASVKRPPSGQPRNSA